VVSIKIAVDVTTPVMSFVVLLPPMIVVVGTTGIEVDLDGISGVVTGSGVVMVMLYGAQKQHDPGTSMNRCPLSSQSS